MDQKNYILRLSENALRPENISSGKCFLCAGEPSTGVGEHVIPKWLQRKYDISNQQLILLNGTRFPYRSLTIPACTNCNNVVLKNTEDFVSKLCQNDLATWTQQHSFEVGRWMAKIFFGFLFKEASLAFDRSQPSLGSIVPADYFDELFFVHLLVQSWRKSLRFNCLHAAHPFTLFVYEIEPDDRYGNFDVSTNLTGKSICIRFGNLGFAFVADGGLQHHVGEFGPFSLAFEKLHPIQFSEIAARVHYKAALRDATHSYVQHEDHESFTFNQTHVLPYANTILSNGEIQIFKPWNNAELSAFFERYEVPGFEDLIDRTGVATQTRLINEAGKLIQSKDCITNE